MEEPLRLFMRVEVKNDRRFWIKVPGFDHFIFGNHKSLKKNNKKYGCYNGRTNYGEGGIKVIPDWCLKS